jgi:hypothetical protein
MDAWMDGWMDGCMVGSTANDHDCHVTTTTIVIIIIIIMLFGSWRTKHFQNSLFWSNTYKLTHIQ